MVVGIQAAKQYRDFTSADGKTISGCIVGYDAAKEIVTFERDNRKTSKVPIGIFCETDQAYIRDWDILNSFATERLFKISIERKMHENEEKSEKLYNKKITAKDTHYAILLENNSACNFKELELEYCIFYEQEEQGSGKEVNKQGVYCGKIPIDSLKPKSKKTLKTDAVTICKVELDSDWYYGSGSDNVQEGEVHGIKIRVHMTASSGRKETREDFFPKGMKSKVWATSSERAGMN